MAPIRVVLIGLAATSNTGPDVGNWGFVAHLKPVLASPKYELVGVCNSSAASSRRAIDFHGLPPTVKAYDAASLAAAGPSAVDLVAVSVNVVSHLRVARPLVAAGISVLVEWPLGATTAEAEELARLARETGARTAVGLQLRADPLLKKVRQILRDGVIGDVRSSVVEGCSMAPPGGVWIDHGTYYLSMKTGGNEFTIFFGHFLDAFTHVLGDFNTLTSIVKSYKSTITLINVKTGQVTDPAYPKDTPDHVFVQGELASGAVASIAVRQALKPVDALGLRWLITGTKGEIEVTMPEGHFQQNSPGRAIRLRVGTDDVQEVPFEEDGSVPEHVKAVPAPGASTAWLYEEYAEGGDGVVDFEDSVKTHKLLDRILKEAKYTY